MHGHGGYERYSQISSIFDHKNLTRVLGSRFVLNSRNTPELLSFAYVYLSFTVLNIDL